MDIPPKLTAVPVPEVTTSCIALVKRNAVEGLMTCVPSVLVLSKITLPS